MVNKSLIAFSLSLFLSCTENHNSNKIKEMLNSKKSDPTEMIKGAFFAGESGSREFIPLLLTDVNDARMCADIRFKGFTVYQEKMGAIRKILKINPPREINRNPDSTIIKFYMKYKSEYK